MCELKSFLRHWSEAWVRRYGLWQEGDAACAERNRATYKKVEEEADSRDGGDGGDGEHLVDRES